MLPTRVNGAINTFFTLLKTPLEHRRHDISDQVWELVPHLLCGEGAWGGNARDSRLFIDAVLSTLRTRAPWRDLPAD